MSARRRLHAVHVSKWRPRVTDLSFYILILAYILHYSGPSWTRDYLRIHFIMSTKLIDDMFEFETIIDFKAERDDF